MTRIAAPLPVRPAMHEPQREPDERELGVIPWAPSTLVAPRVPPVAPAAPGTGGIRFGGRAEGFMREARALAGLARDRPALLFLAGAAGIIVAVQAPAAALAFAAVMTAVNVGQVAKHELQAATTDDAARAAEARIASGASVFHALMSYAGRGAIVPR